MTENQILSIAYDCNALPEVITDKTLIEFAKAIEQVERERCIDIIELYRVPVGNSSAGELAAGWTMDALKEIRDAIREGE